MKNNSPGCPLRCKLPAPALGFLFKAPRKGGVWCLHFPMLLHMGGLHPMSPPCCLAWPCPPISSRAGESSDVPWGASFLWVPLFPHVKGKGDPLQTLHPSPGGGPFAAAPAPTARLPPGQGSTVTPPLQLPQGLGPDSSISVSWALLSQ